MNVTKEYIVPAFCTGECDITPSAATFTMDATFARVVLNLSVMVGENDIDKVVKICHRAQFLQFDPVQGKEDAEEAGEENHIRTECDVLVVEKEEFYFSACIKHTDINVATERQSISELMVSFGLSEQIAQPAQIVIATEGGIVQGVTANVPITYLVYDYDVQHCRPESKVRRPAFDHGLVHTLDSRWVPAYIDPDKIAEISMAVKPPELGKIWWCAESFEEAKHWKVKYLRRGASNIELKARNDGTKFVDVIITLDRSRSSEILEYPVSAEEFLVQ